VYFRPTGTQFHASLLCQVDIPLGILFDLHLDLNFSVWTSENSVLKKDSFEMSCDCVCVNSISLILLFKHSFHNLALQLS